MPPRDAGSAGAPERAAVETRSLQSQERARVARDLRAAGAGGLVAATRAPEDAGHDWLERGPGRGWRGAFAEGRCVAAVGSLRCEARVDGEAQPWGVVTDLFAEDSSAGADGLAACLRDYGREEGGLGEGAAPVLLATVSSPPAHHALRDAVGFEVVRDLLVLEAPAPALAATDAGIDVAMEPAAPPDLAAALPGVGLVRDRALLEWRRARWPAGTTTLVARRDGVAVGWAELRVTDARAVLEDWLVAPDDRAAFVALVAAAARAAGAGALRTSCADTAPEWVWLQELGLRVGQLPAYLLARTWRRPVDPTWLYERLVLTPADLLVDLAPSAL